MKKPVNFLLIFCFSIFVMACNAPDKSKTEENFTDFADADGFGDAHEPPRTLDGLYLLGKKVTFDTPSEAGSAYFVASKSPSKNYLFVIHEWWGLNDNVKKECDRLFKELGESVNVLAVDLYEGKSTADRDEAGKLMQSAKPERCAELIKGAIAYAGPEARIGSIGWCFGGGWSLQTSIMAGDQGAGCVMYYGLPEKDARKIAPLKADVLGIFASKDQWITPAVEKEFKDLMNATGKNLVTHSFEADHAFANPSGDNFDSEAAQKANALALDFLKTRLK